MTIHDLPDKDKFGKEFFYEGRNICVTHRDFCYVIVYWTVFTLIAVLFPEAGTEAAVCVWVMSPVILLADRIGWLGKILR